MGNLLSANLERMRKNVWFLFSLLFMFTLGIYGVLELYTGNIRYGHRNTFDDYFGGYIIAVCILCAILCCIFCGEEYDGGTIRNKVSLGYSRNKIYISQLLSCCIAGIAMCLAYLIPLMTIGMILLGNVYRNTGELLTYLLSGILLIIACISLYCLILTAVQKQHAGTVLTMFILLLIIWLGVQVRNLLNAPLKTYMFINDEITSTLVDNPFYPTGAYRKFLEIMYDFLPSTQAWQIHFMIAETLPRMIISSVIIISLSTWAGLRIFHRKDLK